MKKSAIFAGFALVWGLAAPYASATTTHRLPVPYHDHGPAKHGPYAQLITLVDATTIDQLEAILLGLWGFSDSQAADFDRFASAVTNAIPWGLDPRLPHEYAGDFLPAGNGLNREPWTTGSVTNVSSPGPAPEPGTLLLVGAGFLGLALYAKRRQNR